MENTRNSAIFYKSFYDSIKNLKVKDQQIIYTAIFEYQFYFNEIPLEKFNKTIFNLIKPQLDANIKKYKNGTIPKKPLQNTDNQYEKISKKEAKEKQTESKTEANINDNVNINNNNNKNTNKEFICPTLDEIKLYFFENGYSQDAAVKMFNYYSVADWKDSKGNKVKNWKQKSQSVWFKEENKIKTTPKFQAC